MNALALGIVLALFLVVVPSSGDIAALPGRGPRFLFCPGYRAMDPAPSPGVVNKRKVDPLWLLQNEDEWIPFRSEKSEPSPQAEGQQLPKRKFFGCFIYHIAAFSHYVLDFFFPYYGYPYYRVALEPSFESGPSCSNVKPTTSANCYDS